MYIRDPRLLVDLMAARDMTGASLAERAGRSRQFIHMLYTGKRRACADATAIAIAAALHIDPGELFEPAEPGDTGRDIRDDITLHHKTREGAAA